MFPTIFSLALRDAGTKTKLASSLLIMTIVGGAVAPVIFRKPTRPSLPLRKAPPLSPSLSSIVFTPPSVPPFAGDRNLRSEGENRPTRCSEPLRYKVGGPSKVFAMLCGLGPPGDMVYGMLITEVDKVFL